MKGVVVWMLAVCALARAQSGDGDGDIPGDVIIACPLEEAEDSLVTIIQHPTDCSKFYKCAHGLPVEKSCPKGLLFNDDLKVCDWPYNVDCSGRNPGPSTAAPAPPAPTAPPRPSTQAPQPEGSCPAEDPQDGPAVLLPNPKDPGSFFICSWGVPHLQHCAPGGLVFSSELGVCVWPYQLKRTTTTSTTPRPVICPPGGDENGHAVLLPNPENPGSFFICSWGVPHLQYCAPRGLVFSSELRVCVRPYQLRRTTTTSTTPRPVTCPSGGDENGQAVHIANPNDNTSFYKCSWGVPYLTRCPAGLVFNDNLKVCDWP